MSRLYRTAAAPALAGALLLAPAVTGAGAVFLPAAVAHDALVGATPGDGAVVDTAPDHIELEFSAQPRGTYDTVALSKDGSVLVSDTPTIKGNVLTLPVPSDVDLTDGEYTVGYQITSSDGHATRGSYTFTLDTGTASAPTASGPTAAADTADDNADDAGLPGWAKPALGVAGVIVLLGVIAVLVARLRRTGN